MLSDEVLPGCQDTVIGQAGVLVGNVPVRLDVTASVRNASAALHRGRAATHTIKFPILRTPVLGREDLGFIVADAKDLLAPQLRRARGVGERDQRCARLQVVDATRLTPRANEQPLPPRGIHHKVGQWRHTNSTEKSAANVAHRGSI